MKNSEVAQYLKKQLQESEMDKSLFCAKHGIEEDVYYSFMHGWAIGSTKVLLVEMGENEQ